MLFTFWSPPEYVLVVPVELNLVEFAPWESKEELRFSDWSDIKDYCFLVPMSCGHLGLYLLGDLMERLPGDCLEEEGVGTAKGRDFVGGDKLGMDKVSHRARIYKGGTGDGVLLYVDQDVK